LNPINRYNVSQQLPNELLGEDKISIFLDTDQNPQTGYQPTWLEGGAEYLIQISGKDGRILTHEIMKYLNNHLKTGTNVQSSDYYENWQTLGEIPAYKDQNQLETQVNWYEFGMQLKNPMNLEFIISDWTGESIDSTSTLTSTLTGRVQYESESLTLAPMLFDLDMEPEIKSANEIVEPNASNNPMEMGSRGIFLNDTDTGYVTHRPNQRKLIRDSNDYWYAFWASDNRVNAKRSNDTSGSDWSCPTITLAGGNNPIISGATGDSIFPSVAIYQHPTNISLNVLHLVFTRRVGNTYSLVYSKCTNITNNETFSDSNNWLRGDESIGFDVIEPKINYDVFPQDGVASIALDRFGEPHIVFQLQYGNSDMMINYTKWNNTNQWHNGGTSPIEISPPNHNYRFPTIDIGYNDTIHIAYRNITAGNYHIIYRQCWDIQNSMLLSSWGNTTKSGQEDIALQNASGGDMEVPSIACDAQGRVWITTHEGSTLNNIWVIMEDFKDDNYWDNAEKIADYGNNLNPTIGYDATGRVYCIWQFEDGGDNEIRLSYNDSGSWSAPIPVEIGGDYIYPQIPKNITGDDNLPGYIFKNNTAHELLFISVPELPDFAKIIVLFLFVQIFIMIYSRTTGVQTKSNRKRSKE
jgi:hypothetical protein